MYLAGYFHSTKFARPKPPRLASDSCRLQLSITDLPQHHYISADQVITQEHYNAYPGSRESAVWLAERKACGFLLQPRLRSGGIGQGLDDLCGHFGRFPMGLYHEA